MKYHEQLESEVRYYCRLYPTVFKTATGSSLIDSNGKEYVDFFCGAGSLNYGHNNPKMKIALLDYIHNNGIVQSLDMATASKSSFMNAFNEIILKPKGLNYKMQFTGPTGTNAVEAALKLARITKKRSKIIALKNGYHGLTLGALSVTSNKFYKSSFYPKNMDTLTVSIEDLDKLEIDLNKNMGVPAAILLETIQAEGGVNIMSKSVIQKVNNLCEKYGILLIIDDIQVGNGRSGSFFSFESYGLEPDIVILSKSLSGYGIPMSMLLIKPEIDNWKPGEHSGTFRGNGMAFITASIALEYWKDDLFSKSILEKGEQIRNRLNEISNNYANLITAVRGKGMINGLEFETESIANNVKNEAFRLGLLIETCGNPDKTIKLLPPLTITQNNLLKGLNILESSIKNMELC